MWFFYILNDYQELQKEINTVLHFRQLLLQPPVAGEREGSQGPPQAVSKLASSLQELGLHRQHFPPYTGMVMLLPDTNCR